jgi:hypothetical protein
VKRGANTIFAGKRERMGGRKIEKEGGNLSRIDIFIFKRNDRFATSS